MGNTTRKSVWYRGRWYGNIDITINDADQGHSDN